MCCEYFFVKIFYLILSLSDLEIFIISKLYTSENGTIEFDEFLVMMNRLMRNRDSSQDLLEAFKILDMNQDGFIDARELKHAVLENFVSKIT